MFVKIAAIVTAFNSKQSIRENLKRIEKQVQVVIIVDDSGTMPLLGADDYSDIENVIVLRNQDNLGIAAALNRGIEQAYCLGCDWVITLDDDTFVSESYINDIFRFLVTVSQFSIGQIACSRESNNPSAIHHISGFQIKRNLITSGCVFELKTFHNIGGFDENLFIDLVDFDFCARLRKSGRSLVLLNKVGMAHQVGNCRTIHWFGVEMQIYNHSPFRLYYQMRNVFFFTRKHLTFDPMLSLYLLLDVFRLPFKALFFEEEKRARFFYLATGLVDGLRGRGGKLTRSYGENT